MWKIVGIAADPPQNSHFHFDMMLSMETWDFSRRTHVDLAIAFIRYVKLGAWC
jgi:hypothetical protein